MAKTKLYCAEHKRTFQGGQGFAAHLRRFHPNLPQPTNGHRGPKSIVQLAKAAQADPIPAPTAVTHLESALALVQQKIFNTNSEFLKLNKQRDNIIAALGEDHIPF